MINRLILKDVCYAKLVKPSQIIIWYGLPYESPIRISIEDILGWTLSKVYWTNLYFKIDYPLSSGKYMVMATEKDGFTVVAKSILIIK
jgi:hypothetical protein